MQTLTALMAWGRGGTAREAQRSFRKKTVVALMAWGVLWAGDFRAGAARVKITPPDGTPMAGYFHERGSTGVHDDLWARALALESGGERAALVSCDVIHMPDGVAAEARRLIEKETGLAAGRVMISATHAHTGPEMKGAYAAWAPARIAESVKLALAELKPARLSAAEGEEPTLVFNRRFHMTDGTVGWNPGKLNPKIVRPAGPADGRVAVVSVAGEDGGVLATYVNYGLHLDTVGGTQISADYPYTLGRLVSGAMGGMTTFTLGCAGNVNHIDVKSARRQSGHGEAQRIGTVLAGEVIRTHGRLEPAGDGALRVRREVARLPLAAHRPEDVEWARGVAAKYGRPNAAPFLELVKAMRVLAVQERGGRPLDAEVQVIALGRDVAWVGLPGEIFAELGMEIRKRSPFRHTVVLSLANGHVGYVPDGKAWSQGNYEVVTARCAEGSGERLVETAVRLLQEAGQ